MFEEGRAFGRYVIEALLGEGGMGQVYRARDTNLHRKVALKVLLVPRDNDKQWVEAKARMLREARAAAALEHPNAVGIYDLGEIEDTPYIAMELVLGKNLHAYVGEQNVPWETRLRWLVDAASALAAAHEAGIVHRDVKPENVMVREDGRIKVLDFGIARRATGSASTSDEAEAATAKDPGIGGGTLTGKGVIIGTLRYMPPEQLAGKPLDGRADQFAWGVMAYELFAGDTPWPAHNDVIATVTALVTTEAPPLAPRAPFLPAEVASAIERTLAKSPDARFASMAELIAAIEPFAAPPVQHASVPPRRISVPVPVSTRETVDPNAATAAFGATTGTEKGLAVDRKSTEKQAPRSMTRAALGIGVVAAVALTGYAVVHHGSNDAVGTTSAASAVASAAKPLALTDLPVPASKNEAAITDYREAVQAQHDANWDAAEKNFNEAIAGDPSMGAAHLRLALLLVFSSPTEARAHFSKATELRASMSPYDLALYDGITPLFALDPPDWAAAEHDLDVATTKAPNDAELYAQLGWVRTVAGKWEEAHVALAKALAIDPKYGAAQRAQTLAFQLAGDIDGVLRSAAECLKATPNAAACVHERLIAHSLANKCTDYEADGKRLVAINPSSYEGYQVAAQAQLALGRSPDGAWESLRVGWKNASGDRALQEHYDRSMMTALLADRAALDKELDAFFDAVKDSSERYWHTQPAWLRVSELMELGQDDKAAQAADEYLRKKDAWSADPGVDMWTIALDLQPRFDKALQRGGKITAAELTQRRTAFVDGWRPRLSPNVARYLWIYGYAASIDTKEEAQKALDELPKFSPLPSFRYSEIADAEIGHVYLLAGRVDEALPLLARGAGRCDVFEDPFMWMHASLWLAQAHEAKGHKDEACSAYKNVATRWAGFGTKSLSVKEAKAKLASLACK
jgi:serine/threonine-protein kinase